MEGELIIGFLAVFLIFGAIPLSILVFIHKIKTKQMDTMVKISELGGQVDPETIRLLSGSAGTYKTDYKNGLIWLAIGLPLTLGLVLEDGIAGATFGTIPVFIGIAFLIAGKFRLRDSV